MNYTDSYYGYMDDNNKSSLGDIAGSLSEEVEVEYNVTLMVFRLLICIVGTIGNILVIFVILKLREYKKAVTHWYVLHLAIADCLFLITLPFKVVEDLHNEWIFPEWLCKVKETFLFINYYASVLFLMIMSLDRYIALCHRNSRLEKLRKKRASHVISLMVWMVSLLFCIPIMLFSGKIGQHPNCICQYEFPTEILSAEEHCMSEGFLSEIALSTCIKLHKTTNENQRCTTDDFGYRNDIDLSSFLGNDSDISGMMEGNYFESGEMMTEQEQETWPTDITVPDEIRYLPECTYATSGHGWKVFLIFNFTVMFILPLIIMSVCYSLIALQLRQTGAMLRGSSQSDVNKNDALTPKGTVKSQKMKRRKSAATKNSEKQRRRITLTCFALVLIFIICWLPFHSVHLAKIQGIADRTAEFCTTLGGVAALIAYLNSALNPFVYNFVGMDFKKRLRKATKTWRSTTSSKSSRSSSGGGPTVRYKKAHKKRGLGSSSNSATATTRIYTHRVGSQAPSSTDDMIHSSTDDKIGEVQKSLTEA